ncbi:U-box domain-containing protein 33-like [Trifolium pratense]|uniref:U-box domain-containing protein 33-like n=1 Tax=Trifolium pratense TaxID=57577 RepID=A0A2K3M6E9_TRIPR|nr:U-box domain-containing protein 33-like [Trifolium pratense]
MEQSSPVTNPNQIHLAVGKSLHKTTTLLQWTFNQFRNQEIVLIHLYKPSPVIPTLLGKMPASQANPEVVSAFRREEREQTVRFTDKYLSICYAAKVKASVIVAETDQIQKGIVDLVVSHNIRKLVIGAETEKDRATYSLLEGPAYAVRVFDVNICCKE